MSEKRFILKVDKTTFIIDKQENHRIRDMYRACDLLNKQQATISQLEKKLELKTEEVEYLKRMMVKWGMVKDE